MHVVLLGELVSRCLRTPTTTAATAARSTHTHITPHLCATPPPPPCSPLPAATTQVPLEDDQIFLHFGELQYAAARQQGRLTASQVCYSPSKADTYVTAFRRWLAIYAGGGPFGDVAGQLQALGPRLGREQLLDRCDLCVSSV